MTIFGLSLFLLILTVLSSGQYPAECGPVWVCLMFSLGLDGADTLWEGVPAREHVPLVTSPREVHAVVMTSLTKSPVLAPPWSLCFSHSPLYSLEASHSVEPTQVGRWVKLSFLKLGLGCGSQDHPQVHQFTSTNQQAGAWVYHGWRRHSRLTKGTGAWGGV